MGSVLFIGIISGLGVIGLGIYLLIKEY